MQIQEPTPAHPYSAMVLFWRGVLVRFAIAVPVVLPILLFSHKSKWLVAPGVFVYLLICVAGGLHDRRAGRAARFRFEKPSKIQLVLLLVTFINLLVIFFF